MGEQKTIEQTFQIESPEIEVGLLGTQDKFVSLIEQWMLKSDHSVKILK